ncbi:MAG TPA: hypothetical protein VEG84_03105, partial [Thermoanaerobaculia bacterium]|nr:hypothetical protein [Thermoanaerobaculia bacterium]
NKDLLRAAMDRTNAWDVVIVLVGQQRVNKKPSDMWVYDVYLDKKHPHPRVGSRFEFRGEDKPLFAKTGDGTIYDMRTGEVVEATPPRALPQQATA